jgi:hypothetical protein
MFKLAPSRTDECPDFGVHSSGVRFPVEQALAEDDLGALVVLGLLLLPPLDRLLVRVSGNGRVDCLVLLVAGTEQRQGAENG